MMKKVFIVIILLFTVPISHYGQSSELDSLLNILPLQDEDTSRVWTLRDIARLYCTEDAPKALPYGQQAYDLAKKIGFERGEAKALYSLALANDYNGNTEIAVNEFKRAQKLFLKLGDDEYFGICLNSIGAAFYYQGDKNRALDYFIQAKEYWEKYGNKEQLSKSLNNIGIIFRGQDKYEKAIEIYLKSVELKMELGDEDGLAKTYNNLGIAYSHLEQEEKAIEYLTKGLDYYIKTENQFQMGSSYLSLGMSYMQLGDTLQCRSLLYKAKAIVDTINDVLNGPGTYFYLTKVENQCGNPSVALEFAEHAMKMTEDTKKSELKNYLHHEMAIANSQLGKYQDAYRHLDIYAENLDSLKSSEQISQMEEMQAKYETSEKDKQIEISALKLEQKDKEQWFFKIGIVMIALLLIGAVLLVFNKIKSNKKLAEKNDIIKLSLAEKEILLKEIHHRVKNNLQVVSSLLSIQSRGIQDEKALEAVNESRNRVKSMSLIHQNLYSEESLTGVKANVYMDKLCHSLFSSYKVKDGTIDYISQIDDISLDVETMIPLGLILNELITNVIKYAFEEGEDGKVVLGLKEQNGVLTMTVRDNGIGMKEEDKVKTGSFGLKMIDTFANKLGAEWEMDGSDGTLITIKIKKFKLAS